MQVDFKKIIDYRMRLHRMAELSGQEIKTSADIENFVKKYLPTKIIKLANTGLAVVFDSGTSGITTLFRAELDAIPITEPKESANRSICENASHKCGHDGHMAILCGLAEAIHNQPPVSGKVVLLFQPAEETLEGAHTVLKDPNFKEIEPDLVFAIHNLPGYEAGSVVIKRNIFNAFILGIIVEFLGKTSHAAYPNLAVNPTNAVFDFLNKLNKYLDSFSFESKFVVTPTHIKIGEKNFGLTPGDASIYITLRSFIEGELKTLKNKIFDLANSIGFNNNLKVRVYDGEYSPAIVNDKNAIEAVMEAAVENDLPIIEITEPFWWGEDFGFFTKKYKGAFIGIGNGNTPQLHDPEYHFNDNIIYNAVKLLFSIYSQTNL